MLAPDHYGCGLVATQSGLVATALWRLAMRPPGRSKQGAYFPCLPWSGDSLPCIESVYERDNLIKSANSNSSYKTPRSQTDSLRVEGSEEGGTYN